ncbi:cupin-like domain-containing protein [Croceibacterium sp. LX-88]|uniref:Cupin-like domain-containing protein n=1 Tax=Croceibacterium selenioxidans TaxID=2838833 RepID=A0ABS5W7R4_9SPHN|nr:cupin-like domain-containing protein [Croceibacterium selenioxidans]
MPRLSKVREVSTPASFDDELLSQCEPFVIRGLCEQWPAVREGRRSFDALIAYLAAYDTGEKAEGFVAPPEVAGRYFYSDDMEGFNFERQTMTVTAALDRIRQGAQGDNRESVYLGSVPVARHLPGFDRENAVGSLPQEVEPRIWIGNRSHVSCHFDTYDNLACVVAGRRRFTLFPPELIGDLYVGPIDKTMAGQPVALAVASAPGDPRYPRFEAVRSRALTVDLAPGDALYLPKLWWHEVKASDDANVLINYWWDAFRQGPDAPFTAMMLAMIALAERPRAERAAWAAFFDHYVFRPEGHPLQHLPESSHGILGTIDRDRYAQIRAMLMRQLRH